MEKYSITELRQGVKNPNRVNVFVDGKYALSLDVAQVVDIGVKVGQTVTADELAEMKKASEYGKLYQRTLEWVLTRPHSVRETRDYLVRKLKISSSDTLRSRPSLRGSLAPSLLVSRERSSEDIFELSEMIIERLSQRGYLDDKRFAEWYVENRFVKKGISQRRLKMELMKKGIARDVIDEVIGGRDDEEELRKMIDKKRAKYTPEKLIAYLVRQGFPYDLVRKLVDEIEN